MSWISIMAPLSSETAARFVLWLPCVCVALHVFEEFFWPGGFLAWHRTYRPDLAASITPRFAVIANLVLIAATVVLGVATRANLTRLFALH